MIAAVFPGQGSQKPGMGQNLYESFIEAKRVFDAASESTGIDVCALCWDSDEDTLRQTQNAQLALFTCGVAAWKSMPADVKFMAGHSVGEYTALACAGVISIEDGARLVKKRGELMAASGKERPGTMAAVLGLERDVLIHVCKQNSSEDSVVVIANDNCPGQVVISGDVVAVEAAGTAAKEAGAKMVVPLNVSGAFHSPLLREASVEMGRTLQETHFHSPNAGVEVVSNVTASIVDDPAAWPDLLEMQLIHPVRWTESMGFMIGEGVSTFIEFGVGDVLSGLIKRIDRNTSRFVANDRESIVATREALVEL